MGVFSPDFVTCDPFWEKVPKRTDNFFPDLLIKACVTAYLSYGASFDATLAVILMI